jgi:hypothetical protein
MSGVVFLDTETTGLDADRHELWDIAIIEEDGTEHEWHVHPQHLYRADETAIRLTRYYERVAAAGTREVVRKEGYPEREVKRQESAFWTPTGRRRIAWEIANLTANKHIVGAVPSFDVPFLRAFMGEDGTAGYVPAWHYHLIDVETLIAGRLRLAPPFDSDDLSRAIGVEPEEFERHTAIGDARWVRAQYRAVLAGRAPKIPAMTA